MDELQARIRAIRSLQTDRNLAEQPYPEFDYPDDDQSQGEGNVVELPNRQAQLEHQSEQAQTPRSTSKRKQGTASKRKPTVATDQKAFPFKQMRDGNQQPFIDELKRLEAQAERINQLLAERNRRKVQAQAAEAVKGLPRPAKGGTLGEPRTSAQKQKAAKGAKQTQRSPQQEVSPMPALDDDDTKDLEAQAARIKQLLADLEASLQGGLMPPDESDTGTVGDGVIHTLNAPEPTATTMPTADIESLLSNRYRPRSDESPFPVQNQSSLSDVQKAQQEAVQTAQALRYLANRDVNRERLDPTIAEPIQEELRRRGRSRSSRPIAGLFSIQRYGLRLRQFLQVPQKPVDKVGDAVLWIVMAAVVRVGTRVLLAMVPALSPVFMLLMFAPAAFAVYLALFVPKAGFVSIYRLFLVTLGLVLGGML